MMPGDFIICNDIIGCVQSTNPLRVLCTDNVVRGLQGEPTVFLTGQQAALMMAEKLMRRIKGGNS